METGDKVLMLLLAKVACCVGLALAATGALSGLGVWLLEGPGRWLLGAALIALIAAIILRGSGSIGTDPLAERREQAAPRRLEHER